MSADLRGCAILDPEGAPLAASGRAERLGPRRARQLLEAADAAGRRARRPRPRRDRDGEVFVLRQSGLAVVAVAERFALACLMLFDLRAVLRDLAGARAAERDARSPTASFSTASPATPTRPPPTCAAAGSPGSRSPASTRPAAARAWPPETEHGRELFLAASRVIDAARDDERV